MSVDINVVAEKLSELMNVDVELNGHKIIISGDVVVTEIYFGDDSIAMDRLDSKGQLMETDRWSVSWEDPRKAATDLYDTIIGDKYEISMDIS